MNRFVASAAGRCSLSSWRDKLRTAEGFEAALKECGSISALSAATGIAERTLREWRLRLSAGWTWDGRGWRPPGPVQTTTDESASEPDPISEAARRLREAHEQQRHRLYTETAARLDILLSHIEQAISALPPVEVKPPLFPTNKRRSPMSLVVHLSDWHYGEVVDPQEIMTLNAYDPEIAARRVYQLEKLILTAVDVIGRAHPIPECRILLLGDMVSGAIHSELVETNDLTLYEQWAQLALLLAQFVLRLASKFEVVQIDGVPGNHGRTTQKPSAKRAYVNWDYLTYQTLALMLANQPNVRCNFPRSPIASTEIRGHTYLLWHGDSIKSWAGIPFYGIERAIARVRELMQVKGIQFHYAAIGHFHNTAGIDRAVGEVLMNGSLKGGDEYSVNKLFTYAKPTQLLYFMHEEHGKTWQLGNDLSFGDEVPHPYILQGESLVDAYREATSNIAQSLPV